MDAVLQKLGLSKHESAVYLALLKIGLSSALPIIKQTKLHRQLVYNALDALIEKGLVSYVLQAKRKYFKATKPESFTDYFQQKESELLQQKAAFTALLPQLKAMSDDHQHKQEATVFYGPKGIKTLMNDILQEGKELLTIGASDVDAEVFNYHLRFNLPLFHKEREKKKMRFKVLLSETLRDRAKMFRNRKYSQAKILPKAFTSNTSINIYGDKVSMMMWGSEAFAILIKSQDIAQAQRKHFDLLWKMGKKP